MSDWISVKDKLPKKSHDDVLVKDGKGIYISHLGNDLKNWFDYFDFNHHRHVFTEDVTHWQPLPETPNER